MDAIEEQRVCLIFCFEQGKCLVKLMDFYSKLLEAMLCLLGKRVLSDVNGLKKVEYLLRTINDPVDFQLLQQIKHWSVFVKLFEIAVD